MLKIYIILDDCPPDFGEKEIRCATMTRKAARKRVKELKEQASYENQYVRVVPLNVRIE